MKLIREILNKNTTRDSIVKEEIDSVFTVNEVREMVKNLILDEAERLLLKRNLTIIADQIEDEELGDEWEDDTPTDMAITFVYYCKDLALDILDSYSDADLTDFVAESGGDAPHAVKVIFRNIEETLDDHAPLDNWDKGDFDDTQKKYHLQSDRS